MLIALLILGLIIYKQIGPGTLTQTELPTDSLSPEVPKISNRPNEVKNFETDMDAYLKDEAAKRAAKLDDAVGQ